jgi:hypothetical protein
MAKQAKGGGPAKPEAQGETIAGYFRRVFREKEIANRPAVLVIHDPK